MCDGWSMGEGWRGVCERVGAWVKRGVCEMGRFYLAAVR